jgi:hypothetical protein
MSAAASPAVAYGRLAECLGGTFRIVAGREQLRMWQPPDGGEKWFCGECGSAIFGSNPGHPESIGIRMGTFDDDPAIRPTVRQYVAFAAPWEPLPEDGLPRFPRAATRPARARPDFSRPTRSRRRALVLG